MAWFRNHYTCARCKGEWDDEWSCMCDDDCPHCGARHMSPDGSEDLTKVIMCDGDDYVVLRSSRVAAYDPDYRVIRRFRHKADAEAFLRR